MPTAKIDPLNPSWRAVVVTKTFINPKVEIQGWDRLGYVWYRERWDRTLSAVLSTTSKRSFWYENIATQCFKDILRLWTVKSDQTNLWFSSRKAFTVFCLDQRILSSLFKYSTEKDNNPFKIEFEWSEWKVNVLWIEVFEKTLKNNFDFSRHKQQL